MQQVEASIGPMAPTNAPFSAAPRTQPRGTADHAARPSAGSTAPAFESIASAARRLGIDAGRLRQRCRREGERIGDCAVVCLGAGIVAFKFGGRWRIRFPLRAARDAEHER
jgi:hypothetical protein